MWAAVKYPKCCQRTKLKKILKANHNKCIQVHSKLGLSKNQVKKNFESKSQLLNLSGNRKVSCQRTKLKKILKANHNKRTWMPCMALLSKNQVKKNFESKSQRHR